MTRELAKRVNESLLALGGDLPAFLARDLPCYSDASELVVADVSQSGIEHQLVQSAATAWQEMKAAACDEDVSLILISGFRSFERQFSLLNKRLEAGELIDDLLRVLAPPGCSQHHTGRALDIGTLGCAPAAVAFAQTPAFTWLCQNASRFGFSLSYPKNNPQGYNYEPWHWFLTES